VEAKMSEIVFPPTRPPCFETDEQWEQYKRLAHGSVMEADRGAFTYCTDCTPEYQRKMKCQARCRHPATTFHTREGGLIGRRNTLVIRFAGEARPLHEWARITGLRKQTIDDRLKRGWSVERALTTPGTVQ
jgi:hypothetical protein